MAEVNSTRLHRNVKDLSGQRFGRLVAVEYAGRERWRCQCDCGNSKLVVTGNLKRHTRSCGCIAKQPRSDLTGVRRGLLTVVAIHDRKGGHPRWFCRCDCGGTSIITDYTLRHGTTMSCGCLSSRTTIGDRVRIHGKTSCPEYKVWCGMKRRCLNRNERSYVQYGGRGISICARWANSFEAFLEDMGARPSIRHEVDRIDNNGNYEPGNCRWLLKAKQAQNRRNNTYITHDGKTLCLMEWQRITGIKYATIQHRIYRGWSVSDALTIPVRK